MIFNNLFFVKNPLNIISSKTGAKISAEKINDIKLVLELNLLGLFFISSSEKKPKNITKKVQNITTALINK